MFKRAVAAGARVDPGPMGELADQFWGDRTGTFTDPAGYRWTIATRKEDLSPEAHADRAPGSKVTLAHCTCAGSAV